MPCQNLQTSLNQVIQSQQARHRSTSFRISSTSFTWEQKGWWESFRLPVTCVLPVFSLTPRPCHSLKLKSSVHAAERSVSLINNWTSIINRQILVKTNSSSWTVEKRNGVSMKRPEAGGQNKLSLFSRCSFIVSAHGGVSMQRLLSDLQRLRGYGSTKVLNNNIMCTRLRFIYSVCTYYTYIIS